MGVAFIVVLVECLAVLVSFVFAVIGLANAAEPADATEAGCHGDRSDDAAGAGGIETSSRVACGPWVKSV